MTVCWILNLPRLSVHRKYLNYNVQRKLMYNIVSGHMDFPSSVFVQSNLPYYLSRTSTFNFTTDVFTVAFVSKNSCAKEEIHVILQIIPVAMQL